MREQRAIARLDPPVAAAERGAREVQRRHALGLDAVERGEPGREQRAEAGVRRDHLGGGDVAAGGARGLDRGERPLGVVVERLAQRVVEAAAAPQPALGHLALVGEARRVGVPPEQVALGVVQPVGAALPGDAEARGVGEGAPADPALGLEHGDRKPELARAARGGEPRGAGADDDQIALAQAFFLRAPAALASRPPIPT